MARKLLVMVALMGLVSLIQAPPGAADPYPLAGGTWTEVHGDTLFDGSGNPYLTVNPIPGAANGSFSGYYTIPFPNTPNWNIGNHTNPNLGEVMAQFQDEEGNYWETLKIVYNTGDLSFTARNYGGPAISSSDTVITTIATYRTDDHYKIPDVNNVLQNAIMTMTGTGHNSDGTLFTLAATLVETYADHNHSGIGTDFQLTYPAEASSDPSAVPIPGAVWLLGTGLLGLGCVGRRRKS
jgi:hypothetical protein